MGFGEAPFKNRMTPPQITNFFTWPPLIAVIFWNNSPQKKNGQYLDFNFLTFLYSPTSRYCAHYEDDIYNPYTTESMCLKTNQKKENSISDVLVMARPER